MPELPELLHRAGHRPAKHGVRWICASCPPGKSPALKVDAEVYYCHRCGVGGNVITLRRELGLETVRPRRTPEQRRLRQCARVLASLVKQWEKSQRRWLCIQLKNAMDREIVARDRGLSHLRDGLDVDTATIDQAFNAAQERDWYMEWLDSFDRLTPTQLIAEYMEFRAAVSRDLNPSTTNLETRNAAA